MQRMLKAIERKQIDLVVTKYLSRLGRNYLETGKLIEEFFPKNDVRYIAISDGVDTKNNISNDITPLKCVMNEFYSRDISKKVHASYVSKARNGKFTGCVAPFGYKKSEKDKNFLLVDEETAWIVKLIYEYGANGLLGENSKIKKCLVLAIGTELKVYETNLLSTNWLMKKMVNIFGILQLLKKYLKTQCILELLHHKNLTIV